MVQALHGPFTALKLDFFSPLRPNFYGCPANSVFSSSCRLAPCFCRGLHFYGKCPGRAVVLQGMGWIKCFWRARLELWNIPVTRVATCRRLLLRVAGSVCPAACWAATSPRVLVPEAECVTPRYSVSSCTSAVNLAGMQVSAAVSKQLCFPAHVISILTA